MEVAKGMFRHEIIKASCFETGLHLKASHVHALDLMSFNLQHISRKLEYATPLTWGVIDALLDARSNVQFQGKENLQQDVNYDSWHIEDIDNIPVNAMCGDRSYMQGEMELDEGEIKVEDNSLQQIISSQKYWGGANLLTCNAEGMHDPLNHGQQYKSLM